ncbi:hypothetical protein SynA15127_02233 [Synechococcus sp. A15-127]|nr:hypothetical protein SynA15127_02233 [Synechococcus sp. A15-127]
MTFNGYPRFTLMAITQPEADLIMHGSRRLQSFVLHVHSS